MLNNAATHIFVYLIQATQVIEETLSPTWDQLLVFDEILVYGRRCQNFALGSKNKRQLSTQGRHQGKSPVDHYRDLRSRQGMSLQKSYKNHLSRSYP